MSTRSKFMLLSAAILTALLLGLAGANTLAGPVALGAAATAAQRTGLEAGCGNLPDHAALQAALAKARTDQNGGLNVDMWGTLVNRDGVVCAVAFTGKNRGDQFPGSRVVAAVKANTANSLSLPGLPLSTANLYSVAQPGDWAFGVADGNPVDVQVAYGGDAANYGQANDPMVGKKIGGTIVFGGGLAIYTADKVLVGGLGVSGDSSCSDHNIAWKTRYFLGLDNVPGGVNPPGNDNIIYDISVGANGQAVSKSGFGHPECSKDATTIGNDLPNKFPIGHKS